MKLLWVNHFAVSPEDGGGTRHFEIARELTKLGWRVEIAASDLNLHTRLYNRRESADDRTVVPEVLEGVHFQWLWAMRYEVNNWRRVANWLSFALSLIRWRSSASPDIVIGSSPHLFAALAAARFAARLRVPFVLEVRDLWPESLLAVGARRSIGYWTLRIIANHLYNRAERIIVLAKGVAAHLERSGVDIGRLVYIPNGVNVDLFSERRPSKQDSLTLAYLGAHGPANGLDAVLEAAARVSHITGIHFIFVGDGPSKSILREQARAAGLTNVEFRDPIPKADVPSFLAEVDAGLMVLKDADLFSFGVSPNKLFDYFGAGLPVICNVPGEVAAMVAQAGSGLQAADSTGGALAGAITSLYEMSVQQHLEMGRAGRSWVVHEHSRRGVAQRLDESLRSLLSRDA